MFSVERRAYQSPSMLHIESNQEVKQHCRDEQRMLSLLRPSRDVLLYLLHIFIRQTFEQAVCAPSPCAPRNSKWPDGFCICAWRVRDSDHKTYHAINHPSRLPNLKAYLLNWDIDPSSLKVENLLKLPDAPALTLMKGYAEDRPINSNTFLNVSWLKAR